MDSCTYSLETYNRFQDDDGCPDYIADDRLTADSDGIPAIIIGLLIVRYKMKKAKKQKIRESEWKGV